MPARAEAEFDLQGSDHPRAPAAPSMQAAVDDVAERLDRQLRRYVDRLVTREREPAEPAPGESSHRSWSPPRPPAVVRPIEHREIIRRKSFAFGRMTIEQAADTLEDLDHDFFLFDDADTDADAVLYWRDDGLLALIQPRSVQPLEDHGPAPRTEPILSSDRSASGGGGDERRRRAVPDFENAATGRGNVIYRRYDGHSGLIEPASLANGRAAPRPGPRSRLPRRLRPARASRARVGRRRARRACPGWRSSAA